MKGIAVEGETQFRGQLDQFRGILTCLVAVLLITSTYESISDGQSVTSTGTIGWDTENDRKSLSSHLFSVVEGITQILQRPVSLQ